MMKKIAALTLALALSGFAAQAQVSDTDGNGTFSLEELKAAYPDMDAGLFARIDQDGSGQVDADELQAARENGVIN